MDGRWRRIEELFEEVVDLPADARAAHLDAACAGDDALRREVESLVSSAVDAGEVVRGAMVATAEDLIEDLARAYVGRRVGPYRVLDVLGEGGMGTVYLAERDDGQYRRKVAMKILQHAVASQQIVARFRDERQILANLDHPDIVRLLDGGATDEGLPYLVMELVDGTSLERHASALPVRARVELMVRVCEPIQYAHQQLVVHRDLKPSNILVTAEGVPKLLDFGIAKLLEPGSAATREARTRTGVAMLTPEYASPEQVRGESISIASDVYSLGAVLYHVLAGRPPQGGSDDVLAALVAICQTEPPRPSTVAPRSQRRAIAGDLDNITLRALQKAPADRYPSVAAFADDLQRYLDGRPVHAREATLGYRAVKFVRRNRTMLALTLAIIGALTALTVISFIQAERATEASEEAQRQTRTLLVEQGRQALGAGHAGRALPFLVDAWQRGEDTAALRFLVAEAWRPFERELATVSDFPRGMLGTAWSPDGMRFVACGDDGRIALYDADGVLERALDERPAVATRLGCGFDPSGRRVVAFGSNGRLSSWDAATGEVIYALPDPMTLTERSSWTGNVTQVVIDEARIVACRFDGPTQVWDLATGEQLVRLPDAAGHSTCAATPDGARVFVSGSGRVLEYDLPTGQRVRDLTMLVDPRGREAPTANGAELSRDGTRLAFAHGARVWIWDVAGARVHVELIGHANQLRHIGWSSDGLRIVTTDMGGGVKVWDTQSGTMLADLTGHGRNAVLHASFDLTRARVVTTASDNTFRVFAADGHLETSLETVARPGAATRTTAVAVSAEYSPDGTRILSHIGSEALVWRAGREPLLAEITTRIDVMGGALSPGEDRLLVVGRKGLAEVRAQDGALVATLEVPDQTLWDASWSARDVLAVCGDSGFLALFSARGGPPLKRLEGHAGTVNGVRFSPDGAWLASAGDDRGTRLWEVETGASRTLAHPGRVLALDWSRDGRRLATAGGDGQLRVWDVASGRLEASVEQPGELFLTVAFTPDQTGLAGGTRAGVAGVWDIASGRRHLTLEGHNGPVTWLAYSPDGALLASTCVDSALRIWDPATGIELARRMQSIEILQASWLSDSTRIVSFGNGPAARLWDARRALGGVDEVAAAMRQRVPWRLVGGRVERSR